MIAFLQVATVLPFILSSVAGEAIKLKQRDDVKETLVQPRPDLGAAAYFTLLTKTGISVVPTVSIYGNVGVAPASMSYLTGLSLEVSADFDHGKSSRLSSFFSFSFRFLSFLSFFFLLIIFSLRNSSQ